jgi:hypothetical protein
VAVAVVIADFVGLCYAGLLYLWGFVSRPWATCCFMWIVSSYYWYCLWVYVVGFVMLCTGIGGFFMRGDFHSFFSYWSMVQQTWIVLWSLLDWRDLSCFSYWGSSFIIWGEEVILYLFRSQLT